MPSKKKKNFHKLFPRYKMCSVWLSTTVIYMQVIEVHYSNVNNWKGEARGKGERERMMAGGKRCDGTLEQVLMCHLHKESHGGKPWAKVSGKLCQILRDAKVAWMLMIEGSINYLCKHQLDVIPAFKWTSNWASWAHFCKTPFQGSVILAV